MYQPQVLEVDPHRIKFNALNPRKHGGEEYEALKASIQEIGIVQMPLVRSIPGGFYEVIDGEGRVSVAQELNLPKIQVTSLGMVQDEEALTMLVTSNTVREFSFIARCKGMAELNKKGMPGVKIAKVLGMHERNAQQYIAIGHLPGDLFSLILQNPPRGGIAKIAMGGGETGLYHLMLAVLPLRQVKPGKDPRTQHSLEGVYDYVEVRHAIEKTVKGEISDVAQMKTYVAERRHELFQQRFDAELRSRLQAELDDAKKALEEANEQQLQDVEAKTRQRYENDKVLLEAQIKSLEEKYNKTVVEVAKTQADRQRIEKLQRDLDDERRKTETERKALQDSQSKMQKEIQDKLEADRKALQAQIEKDRQDYQKERQRVLKEEQKKVKDDLEALYAEKDEKRQIKAVTSIRQMNAHGVQLLAQTQQWILHITAPEVLKGLSWLDRSEIVSLLAQMRAVHDILEDAEETIQHGEVVHHEESIHERSLANGR